MKSTGPNPSVRDLTHEESVRVNVAWKTYLEASEKAWYAGDMKLLGSAWEAYQRTLKSMRVCATLAGYRVQIKK